MNTTFTLMFAPSPAASLELYLNGLLMAAGVGYQLAANEIIFYVGSISQFGHTLVANYRYANPSNPRGCLGRS